MANKKCSRKENCVVGNVEQPYSNFYRNIIKSDQHEGICKSCMAEARQKLRDQKKEEYAGRFNMFIG